MLAGTLASAGWDVGDNPYPGREANPKGFFETEEINGINEALLEQSLPAYPAYGHMQRWLAEAPRGLEIELGADLQQRIETLGQRPGFAFKDPRFCYTMPAWRSALGEFGTVCVFREPAVTAASIVKECASADYLNDLAMDFDRAVDVWTSMYTPVLEKHRHEGDWLFIHFDQLLTEEGISRLEAFVGAPVSHDFPEAKLSRSKSSDPVPEEAAALYSQLCELAGYQSEPIAVREPWNNGDAEYDLTVLICSYQRCDTLMNCLASFCKQTAPEGSFEIVVVNDGSNDGTREALDAYEFNRPVQIVHQENGGLSAARNAGLKVARGKLVLLINDDTIAFPNLVEAHIVSHKRAGDKKIAVQGTFEQPREVLNNALMRVLEENTLVFCYASMTPGETYDWNRFWTCNVSVPTNAVRAVGNFDVEFRHYGCEDTDLALRLNAAGYSVYYEGQARAHHEHILTYEDVERRTHTVGRAWVRLFRKHPRALLHPDWAWVQNMSIADNEAVLAQDRELRAKIEELVSELSTFKLHPMEALGSDQRALADSVREQLATCLKAVHRLWWLEGMNEGLREFGYKSFDELLPFPLGTEAPGRVLAWPRYDRDEDLEHLKNTFGQVLMNSNGLCLCLRHDPKQDGPLEDAVARIEACLAPLLEPETGVEVLLVDNTLDDVDVGRLGSAVDCIIDLAANSDRSRNDFFGRLGRTVVSEVEEMVHVLVK